MIQFTFDAKELYKRRSKNKKSIKRLNRKERKRNINNIKINSSLINKRLKTSMKEKLSDHLNSIIANNKLGLKLSKKIFKLNSFSCNKKLKVKSLLNLLSILKAKRSSKIKNRKGQYPYLRDNQNLKSK